MNQIVDPIIQRTIDDISINLSDFRTSKRLKIFLSELLQLFMVKSLSHVMLRQNVKVRLDSTMKMCVVLLCFPNFSSLLGLEINSTSSNYEKHQMDIIKSILVEVLQTFKVIEESIFVNGSSSSCDQLRIDLCLNLIRLRTSTITPIISTILEHGPILMSFMAEHILSVRALSLEVLECIDQVLTRVRLAMIPSDPHRPFSRDEVFEVLALGFQDFISWLRARPQYLVRTCRESEVLACGLEPSMRAWIRCEEYSSPLHLIQAFHKKYKLHLTRVPIPLHTYDRRDLSQAEKDLRREVIKINKQVYFPFGSSPVEPSPSSSHSQCPLEVIRNALRSVLSSLYPEPSPPSSPSFLSSLSTTSHSSPTLNSFNFLSPPSSPPSPTPPLAPSSQNSHPPPPPPLPPSPSSLSSSTLRSCLLDCLYSYCLLSISRSFAGGDAFFLLRDMYGGEGLLLTPNPLHSCQPLPTSPPSPPPSPSTLSAESLIPTISISPRGVRAEVREIFDLQDQQLLSAALARSPPSPAKPRLPAPLMSFLCTTTTLLVFRPESIPLSPPLLSPPPLSSPPSSPSSSPRTAREGKEKSGVGVGIGIVGRGEGIGDRDESVERGDDSEGEGEAGLYRRVLWSPESLIKMSISIEPLLLSHKS